MVRLSKGLDHVRSGSRRHLVIQGGGSPCLPLMTPKYLKYQKNKEMRITSPYNEDIQSNFLYKSDVKCRQEIARR